MTYGETIFFHTYKFAQLKKTCSTICHFTKTPLLDVCFSNHCLQDWMIFDQWQPFGMGVMLSPTTSNPWVDPPGGGGRRRRAHT